jgi:tetratricopeptide (TPR) repeat protein
MPGPHSGSARVPAPEGLDEPIRRARATIARAAAVEQAGRYDEALVLAREAEASAEAIGWPPLVADVRTRIGSVLERDGDYEGAEASLTAAYFGAAAAGAAPQAARAASQLAYTVGYRRARPGEGLIWSRLADVETGRVGGDRRRADADRLNGEGAIHWMRGDYDQARVVLSRALELREQTAVADDPELGHVLNNLALVYERLGEWERALELSGRALEIWTRAVGEDHPLVATVLNNMAIVHHARKDHTTARDLCARALAIREASLGREHPLVASGRTTWPRSSSRWVIPTAPSPSSDARWRSGSRCWDPTTPIWGSRSPAWVGSRWRAVGRPRRWPPSNARWHCGWRPDPDELSPPPRRRRRPRPDPGGPCRRRRRARLRAWSRTCRRRRARPRA